MFVEDQPLKDVEKADAAPQHSDDDLTDLDPIPPRHAEPQPRDDIDDDHGTGDVDASEQDQMDYDTHQEPPVIDIPPFVPLTRSARDRHPSSPYSVDNYVLVTDGGEPEGYA